MVDYLAREGYLRPTYQDERARGKIRFYSYRDLLIARLVERLRQRGLELKRLKSSIQLLSKDETWFPKGNRSFELLSTDGKKLYYHDRKGSLVELTPGHQRAFAFVLDVAEAQREVKKLITRVASRKLTEYTIENRPLIYLDNRRKRA